MRKSKQMDLTVGKETQAIILFSIPLIVGNFFQQLYNLIDTMIVGNYIGADALAAVGSSFMTMNFLNAVIIGLCMGCGVIFSWFYGAGEQERLRRAFFQSFLFVAVITAALASFALIWMEPILNGLHIETSIFAMTKSYLFYILCGMGFVFLYNYCTAVLRSIGNSVTPLYFLIVASLINIVLDYIFVVPLKQGVVGAAIATVIAQAVSAIGIMCYTWKKLPEIRFHKTMLQKDWKLFRMLTSQSLLTSMQQSIMNFGILMIQGLVNQFGITIMAGFAAAVKIDSFAYMPVQDFGNAFSTFVAQNYGAGKHERIENGKRSSIRLIVRFCAVVSVFVFVFAKPLMQLFLHASEHEAIYEGVRYLRIVSPFYFGIGFLFLLYGLYRGIGKPEFSIVLTILSLGTRVLLAYTLSPIAVIGVPGIWWAIPIGWILADTVGFLYYRHRTKRTSPLRTS